jgi:hypothetical protein
MFEVPAAVLLPPLALIGKFAAALASAVDATLSRQASGPGSPPASAKST